MKKCNKCKQLLEESEFTKVSKSKDGLDWSCRKCKREAAIRYINSDRGKQIKAEYRKKDYPNHLIRLRRQREKYAQNYPEKVKARHLIGQAVRRGLIPAPSIDKYWWNRWEFHHPDHNRPYYGCWVLAKDHKKIDKGLIPCPPLVDYEPQVRVNLLKEWQINE